MTRAVTASALRKPKPRRMMSLVRTGPVDPKALADPDVPLTDL
ncbi:hypothetical protein [Kitasatospora sp. NPDC056181]